jgi:hypothetical protein
LHRFYQSLQRRSAFSLEATVPRKSDKRPAPFPAFVNPNAPEALDVIPREEQSQVEVVSARWRLLRSIGAGRWRAALWMMGGGR